MILHLLLSLLLLLAHTSEHSMAFITPNNTIDQDDADCLVFFGLKKLFVHDTNSQLAKSLLFFKNNFPVLPDANIYIKSLSQSPSVILTNFSNQVPSSLYDIVWLEPNADALNCQYFEAYITQCQRLKLNCGFSLFEADWEEVVGDDRMGCKQAAALPLFYRDGAKNWRPMGGWNRYMYTSSDQLISYCDSENFNITVVEKFPGGQLKVERREVLVQ